MIPGERHPHDRESGCSPLLARWTSTRRMDSDSSFLLAFDFLLMGQKLAENESKLRKVRCLLA